MTRHSVLTTPLRVPTAGAGPPWTPVDNAPARMGTVPRPVGTGTGGTVPRVRTRARSFINILHLGGFKEAEAYY